MKSWEVLTSYYFSLYLSSVQETFVSCCFCYREETHLPVFQKALCTFLGLQHEQKKANTFKIVTLSFV